MAAEHQNQQRRELITSLCDLQIPSSIQFSPDAKQIVYSTQLSWGHRTGDHPTSTLWLAETGKPGSSRQITSGEFKDCSPRWSPDGGSVAFISDRAGKGEKWAVWVVDVKGGKGEGEGEGLADARAVTDVGCERMIEGFKFSPDGRSIAFISKDEKTAEERRREEEGCDWEVWGEHWTYSRLRVVDLETKKVKRLTGSWDPKNQPERHITAFSWSPDSQRLAVVSTKTPSIDEAYLTGSTIAVLYPQSSSIESVCTFPNYLRSVEWASDGRIYFASGTRTWKVCAGRCVYAVFPDTKPSKSPTGKPKWEKVAFGETNDVDTLTAVSGEVVAKVEHRLEDQICQVPSGRVLYSKKQQLEAFDAAYAVDSDEIMLAIATSDTNTPVEVYTTTASGGGMVQLSNHGAAFKHRTFGSCNFFTCRSTDDEVELDGIYLTPSGHSTLPSQPLPTVVLIHGGPDSKSTNAFNTFYYFWSPYLLSLGYGILLTNYRGSSGRGQRFAEYSCKGVGKWDYADVVAITNHAIELGYADKERTVIGGWSQGGFLSYLCSVRNGDHGFGWRYKAAIPGAGICDTDTMALTSDLGATLETELNAGRAPWGMDKDDTRNRQASALWEFKAAMDRSKSSGETVVPPMLILHGEKDERCPVTQAWGMRRALASEGLPFEMVTYPRQPHLFEESKFWVDMAERVGRWCDKWIGNGKVNMEVDG